MKLLLQNKTARVGVKLFLVCTTLILISNLLIYRAAMVQRKNATFGVTLIAPNHEYRIDKYYIGAGEPMLLLFKVYDKNNVLIAKHTREVWPGAGAENWNCTPQRCTEFIYSIGEVESIPLPPTWLDGIMTKIP